MSGPFRRANKVSTKEKLKKPIHSKSSQFSRSSSHTQAPVSPAFSAPASQFIKAERDKAKINRVLNAATEIQQQSSTRPNSMVIKSMLASAQEASDGLKSKKSTKTQEAESIDDNSFQVGAFYILTAGMQLVRSRSRLALDDQYFSIKGSSSSVKLTSRLYNELVQSGLGAQSQRPHDLLFMLKKSMSFEDIISHLWNVFPLLMEYLDDMDPDSSLTANPFYSSIYRREDQKYVPNLFFVVKEGRKLEHAGNHLLFPNGRDIYDIFCKSKKTAIGERVIFIVTLDEISKATQRLWRAATIYARENGTDPRSALQEVKAQDEAAAFDKKGKRKALLYSPSDLSDADMDDSNSVEAPRPPYTQKRARNEVSDSESGSGNEEGIAKKKRTSKPSDECIEISDGNEDEDDQTSHPSSEDSEGHTSQPGTNEEEVEELNEAEGDNKEDGDGDNKSDKGNEDDVGNVVEGDKGDVNSISSNTVSASIPLADVNIRSNLWDNWT
ncbi:hypothetical protein F5876DRAFT_80850 [Lentinula aff. lateritia]|uniref:Uncharacterized protein n=1 Tax=Lentinula aff. lateritia TaxID=2804960 RepID=A0ACC1TNW6_9AGAR|nr:hypothetical protein F5876DRAFT_80850 [Lentinula aff. lateritia]